MMCCDDLLLFKFRRCFFTHHKIPFHPKQIETMWKKISHIDNVRFHRNDSQIDKCLQAHNATANEKWGMKCFSINIESQNNKKQLQKKRSDSSSTFYRSQFIQWIKVILLIIIKIWNCLLINAAVSMQCSFSLIHSFIFCFHLFLCATQELKSWGAKKKCFAL